MASRIGSGRAADLHPAIAARPGRKPWVRKDVKVCDIIAETMRSNGIRVWVDKEDLPPGSVWIDETTRPLTTEGATWGGSAVLRDLPRNNPDAE